MAENRWGKSPPKAKSHISPDMLKESFWGPAEVPDQVRGTPRVTTWGGPRPWDPQDPNAGIDPDLSADSWVSGEADPGEGQPNFNFGEMREREQEAPAGREQGPGETNPNNPLIREQGPGEADPNSPLVRVQGPGETNPNNPLIREQGPGEADSWVSGEADPGEGQPNLNFGEMREGTDADPFAKESTDGQPNLNVGEMREREQEAPPAREQGAGERDSWVDGLRRVQGAGEADSWVSGEAKPGEGKPNFNFGEMRTGDEFEKDAIKKGERGEYDFETVRIGGENDTWADGRKREQGPGAYDSWVQSLVRKQGAGEADSWVSGEAKPGEGEPNFEFGEMRVGTETASPEGQDFTTPLTTFDPVVQSGSFDKGPGFSKALESNGWTDPFVGGWNFRVKINGIPEDQSKFVSVSGINIETESIEFRYGSNSHIKRIPGKEKYGEIEFVRIMQIGNTQFSRWRNQVARGLSSTKDITVQIFHTSFKTMVMEIQMHDCYISKWEFPELNAGASDGAMEKITIIPSYIRFVDKKATAPTTAAQKVGADMGTAPPPPLSLSAYNQQLADNLDAAMGRMGVSEELESGRKQREENERKREAQAKKAKEWREAQKAARS